MPEETPNEGLSAELEKLRQEIADLNDQNFMRMHSSWPRFIFMNLVRGLIIGFGSVVGATLLVYVLIEFLSNIDFIPVLGQWAREIVVIINQQGGTQY